MAARKVTASDSGNQYSSQLAIPIPLVSNSEIFVGSTVPHGQPLLFSVGLLEELLHVQRVTSKHKRADVRTLFFARRYRSKGSAKELLV